VARTSDDVIFLTPEGYEKKKKELEYLIKVRRPEMMERVRQSQAREFVDVEENADIEFEEAKREQALLEAQIEELRKLLLVSEILDASVMPKGEAGLGSRVTLRDLETNEEWTCQVVSAVEADPDENRISVESPLGSALMGRRGGDLVEVNAPGGLIRYKVIRVVNRLGSPRSRGKAGGESQPAKLRSTAAGIEAAKESTPEPTKAEKAPRRSSTRPKPPRRAREPESPQHFGT